MADLNIDLSEIDFSNIGAWPMPVKVAMIAVVCVLVLVLGYFLDISNQRQTLVNAEQQEIKLKGDFEKLQQQAANLEIYQQQLKQLDDIFAKVKQQLPSKTEVENLVDEISQKGHAAGVEFVLFKPMPEQFIEFYTEKPIAIEVTGTYHQFGRFVSGIAALPRIVTLHNIKISRDAKTGRLTMQATAKTYRYLEQEELEAELKKKKERERKKKGRR